MLMWYRGRRIMNRLDQIKEVATSQELKVLVRAYAELHIIEQHMNIMNKYIHSMCEAVRLKRI